MSIDQKRRVIFVTGSSGGLCREILPHLAKQGYSFALVDLNEPPKEFLESLKALGADVFPQRGNLTSTQDISMLASKAIEHFPQGIYALINGAAIFPHARLIEETPESITRSFQVNLMAPLLLSKALLPSMKKNKIGRIINFASGTTGQPQPGLGLYSTMKTAIIGLTRALARDGLTGPDFNFTVNSLSPGLTRHENLEHMPAIMFEKAIEAQSIPRALKPEDLFSTFDYLLSEYSSATTGQTINCDGGSNFGV